MTQKAHTTGEELLRDFDRLADQLSVDTDPSERRIIELKQIDLALEAADMFHRAGDFLREASAYLLAIGVLLGLKNRNMSPPGNKPFAQSVIECSVLAYEALQQSGSCRFQVTGTQRILRWLYAAHTLAEPEEKPDLEKALEEYTARLVAAKALLYRMEDDGFNLLRESGKHRVYAMHTTDASLKDSLTRAAAELQWLALKAFSATGNYAVMDELLSTETAMLERSIEVPTPAPCCPRCKTEYFEGDLFCANCGFELRNVAATQVQTCQKCGASIQPGYEYCIKCGKPVSAAAPRARLCPKCGQETEAEDVFCPQCGNKL